MGEPVEWVTCEVVSFDIGHQRDWGHTCVNPKPYLSDEPDYDALEARLRQGRTVYTEGMSVSSYDPSEPQPEPTVTIVGLGPTPKVDPVEAIRNTPCPDCGISEQECLLWDERGDSDHGFHTSRIRAAPGGRRP